MASSSERRIQIRHGRIGHKRILWRGWEANANSGFDEMANTGMHVIATDTTNVAITKTGSWLNPCA